jgi:transposase-like protein
MGVGRVFVMPKAYSLEFKRRAIDLVLADGGRSIVVAVQVGVSHSCLQGWVRQAKIDQGKLPES